MKGQAGYEARKNRAKREKKRRTRWNKDTWDANNGMYEVYGTPFNAPPMDNEARQQDITGVFAEAPKQEVVAASQHVGDGRKMKATFTTEPGKKYRLTSIGATGAHLTEG